MDSLAHSERLCSTPPLFVSRLTPDKHAADWARTVRRHEVFQDFRHRYMRIPPFARYQGHIALVDPSTGDTDMNFSAAAAEELEVLRQAGAERLTACGVSSGKVYAMVGHQHSLFERTVFSPFNIDNSTIPEFTFRGNKRIEELYLVLLCCVLGSDDRAAVCAEIDTVLDGSEHKERIMAARYVLYCRVRKHALAASDLVNDIHAFGGPMHLECALLTSYLKPHYMMVAGRLMFDVDDIEYEHDEFLTSLPVCEE